MSYERVRGAKGSASSGAQAHTPYEAPNSLTTSSTLRLVHLVSEGQIGGLVNGGQSIYLDDVPLIAADGTTPNFNGVSWTVRIGEATQAPLSDFTNIESYVDVGVQVKKGDPGPIIRTVNLQDKHRIRFIIQVNGLLKQEDNGDLLPTSVAIRLECRQVGSTGAWTHITDHTIEGKTTSPYQRSITVPTPQASGNWDFRVTRLTDDSTTSKLVNATYWAGYTLLSDVQIEYANSAVIATNISAKNFGSNVPTMSFELYGLYCLVPQNYDPTTRTYATSGPGTTGGTWDGYSIKYVLTDNPAWIFYTICCQPIWGLAREINFPRVDQYALYEIAKYCDQMVPNGFGGTEPRFTFNGTLNEADEAFRILQSVASVFRGSLYWGGGKIVAVADMPRNPSKLVTPANVVDGKFDYEGSSFKVRHSSVKVRWRDPANRYRIAVETADDPLLINEVGLREMEIDAIGCTSRGQARRLARWVLYTEKYETELISYRAAFDHANVRPGDVILVQDPYYASVSLSGRILGVEAPGTLEMDRNVVFESGKSYTVRFTKSDGSITDEVTVTNSPGTTNELQVGSIPVGVSGNSIWLISATDVKPTQWRVISVREEGDSTYAVQALRHYPGKYDLVELGIALDNEQFTRKQYLDWNGVDFDDVTDDQEIDETTALRPPTNVTAAEALSGVGGTILIRVTVSWQTPSDPRVARYQVQAVRSNGVTAWEGETNTASLQIDNLVPAQYRFQVRSLSISGGQSVWATTGLINVDGVPDALDPPAGLLATGGIRQNTVQWNASTSRIFSYAEVHSSSNTTFGAGAVVGRVAGTTFIHSGLSPSQTWYYWVRFVDTTGQATAWVGPVSATTSQIVANDIQNGILDTAKFAAGLGPIGLVNGVPVGKGSLPDIIFDTITGLLYKWDGDSWEPVLNPEDLGLLIAANFPSNLRPVETVATMPTTGNTTGRVVYLTATDSTSFPGTTFTAGKLYRWTGSAWTAEVPAADITGALAAGNFPANLRPVEVVSSLPVTGLTDGRVVYLSTDQKIYRYRTTAPAGWIKDVDGSDIVAGTVSANAIAANAILASKLYVGDPSNVYPDYDMRDAAYYSGSAFTLAGSTSNVVGQNWLQIASSGSSATVQSAWFTLEPSTDYAVSGAAWLASAGSTTATLSLELGSVDSAGVVSSTRSITVQTATTTTTPAKASTTFQTTSSERRGRFVMAKSSTSGSAVRFGGFVVRRRATGELIVDGSITTEKMNAGSINADRLVAGSVSAAQLAADSILASKIYIGESGNAFPDYDMEDAAYYSGGTFSFGQLVNTALGRQYLNIASSSSPVTVVSDWFPVEASADYSVYGASWLSGAASTATALYIELGSVATNGTVTVERAVTIQAPTSTTTVTRQIVNITTASNEKRMRFNMQKSNVSGAAARYGGFIVRRRAGGQLIVDGSITTTKLAANAVTANELAANAVVAGKIQAGAVNTNELAANAITAAKLATTELITLSAQIGDLTVITAKIGGDAVSTFKQSVVPRGAYTGGSGTSSFFWVSGTTFTVPTDREGFALGYADVFHSSTPRTYFLRIKVNGSEVFRVGGVNAVAWPNIMTPISLTSGSNTVEMEWAGEDSAVGVGSTGLIIFSRAK